MTLRLVREPSIDGKTLSVWFVNGRYECFGIEDQIREQPGQPVSAWKVPKHTAIPAGRYRLLITLSQRFGRRLPLLLDVPGFSGVRIHPGNTIEDTEGCPLPGRIRAANRVGESRLAMDKLMAQLEPALARGEDVWVVLENPRVD